MSVLAPPIEAPRLRGFAELLRADLLTELGRFEEAEKALDEADQSNPKPTLPERIEVRVALQIAQGRFDDA